MGNVADRAVKGFTSVARPSPGGEEQATGADGRALTPEESKERALKESLAGSRGRFVVRVHSAEHVRGAGDGAAGALGVGPSVNGPYAVFWVEGHGGSGNARKGMAARTPSRRKTEHPVWSAAKDLYCVPNEATDVLVLQVRDSEPSEAAPGSARAAGGRLLGETRVPVRAITERPHPHRVGYRCLVTLSRAAPPRPATKTVFLVRHGQSHWNRAQEDMDLGGLAGFDHGLNEAGVSESRDLNRRWREAASGSPAERAWARATRVYSSPLTRAVTTAAVALHGHPALEGDGGRLVLLSSAREVKGIGGMDCVGVASGAEEVARRALLELGAVVGEDEARRVMCAVDANDCTSPWWTPATSRDSRREVRQRLRNFWEAIQFDGHACSIVVGHSNFGRELCRHYLGPGVSDALGDRLRAKKLQNAGVVALTVSFEGVEPVVTAAELVFGSTLADEAEAPPPDPVPMAALASPPEQK